MPEKYTRREFSKIAGATATFQLGDDDDEDGILSRIFGDDEQSSSSNTEGAVYVDVENELESVNPGPNEVFITTDTERIFKPTDDGKWTEFASLGGDSPWVENADGSVTPENDQPVNVGEVNNTVRIREGDDLQTAIDNATNGDTLVIDDGPAGRHDVDATITCDNRLTIDFRNRLVPTGDFPVLKTTEMVTLVGRGVPRCIEDADNNLSSTTDAVVVKSKLYTQGMVFVDLGGNGQDGVAFIQDPNEGTQNLNHSGWAFWVNNPGRDAMRFENVGTNATNLNAMHGRLIAGMNSSGRHGLNMVDGKRNVLWGVSTGGTGRAFVGSGDGKNLYYWDWEGISVPTGHITSSCWMLNGSGWYNTTYGANGTMGLETVAIATDGITITVPDPAVVAQGTRKKITDYSGNAGTNAITVQIDGGSSYSISKNYGSITLHRHENGSWLPEINS